MFGFLLGWACDGERIEGVGVFWLVHWDRGEMSLDSEMGMEMPEELDQNDGMG